MNYELYLITNTVNGKDYVGQTKETVGYQKRFERHWKEAQFQKKHCYLLHKAMLKYGIEAFTVKRLMHNIPEKDIDDLETLWILKLGTLSKFGHGYNMTTGGQGVHGYQHTEETVLKMSKSCREWWEQLRNDPEKYNKLCEQRSISRKGKKKSVEHRKKLSIAAKKRFENQDGTFKGRKHKQSTKDLLSAMHSIPVGMYDKSTGELLKKFSSATAATEYLIENNLTSNKSAFSRILKICHGIDKSAYGYVWKFLQEV